MTTVRNNGRLMAEIDRIAEVAGYLWTKGWAERTFPTPYGIIKIRHEKGADGKIISHIDAPEEIRIIQ